MKKGEARCFAGLDVGGTSVKSMLTDAAGNRLGEMVEVPSRVKEGYAATFDQLEEALFLLTEQAGRGRSDVAGIGLDVPAPSSGGIVRVSSRLHLSTSVGVAIRLAWTRT